MWADVAQNAVSSGNSGFQLLVIIFLPVQTSAVVLAFLQLGRYLQRVETLEARLGKQEDAKLEVAVASIAAKMEGLVVAMTEMKNELRDLAKSLQQKKD